MSARTFLYTDAKSNKFWTIELSADGKSHTVTYGKTGTTGQTLTKDFPTADACHKAAEKLIAEKTGKGYVEQSAGPDGADLQPATPCAASPARQLVTYNFGRSEYYQTLDLAADMDNEQGIGDTLHTISVLLDDKPFVKKLRDQSPGWRFGTFADGKFAPAEMGGFNSEYEFYNRAFQHTKLLPLMEDIVKKVIRENENDGELTSDDCYVGSNIAAKLAVADKTKIPLYLRYLRTIDLDNENGQDGEISDITTAWGWCPDTFPLLAARYFSLSGQSGTENILEMLGDGGSVALAKDETLRNKFLEAICPEIKLSIKANGGADCEEVAQLLAVAFPSEEDPDQMAAKLIELAKNNKKPTFKLLGLKQEIEETPSATSPHSDAPPALLSPRKTALRELVTIKTGGTILELRPFDDTHIVVLTDTDKKQSYNLLFCSPAGVHQTVSLNIDKSLCITGVTASGLHVYADGVINLYNKHGELIGSTKVNESSGATKYWVDNQSRIYYYQGKTINRIGKDNEEAVAELSDEISLRPFVLKNDDILVFMRTTPRTLVHLAPDGKEKWRTTIPGTAACQMNPCGDNKVVCMSNTYINLVDVPRQKCVSVPVLKGTATTSRQAGSDRAAYAGEDNTVVFASWSGKTTATFLRDKIGVTNKLPIAADGVSVFVPSLGKSLYRLAADGSCTGVCTLPSAYTEKSFICATGDGMVAASDGDKNLYLIPDSAFVPGETPKPPVFLTKRAAELEKHFAPWAATNTCKAIIKDVLARLSADRSEGDTLELDFLTTQGETLTVTFSAPALEKAPADFPESYRKATELHGSVSFDHGDGAGFYWSGDGSQNFDMSYDDYEFEADKKGVYSSNEERYAEIALAGQNCFIIDRGRTNKLGEPLILMFDHGGDFTDANIFGGSTQRKTAYGIPGFIFRVLGHCVLEDDPRFEDCDMG